MEKLYERWKYTGNLQQMQMHKEIFREPKDAEKYQQVMDNYYAAIYNG
jgi:DNA polymerase III delta prime subunit